jgi:hypothetical protein
MQQGEASTQQTSFVKRVSVRTGGAGHAQSGVTKAPDSKNGAIDGQANVLRSTNSIVVRLGT